MRLIQLVLILAMLAGLCGCDTDSARGSSDGTQLQITVIAPEDGMFGGENASWTALIQGTYPPYQVTWDFDNGAVPNTVVEAVNERSQLTVKMKNPSNTELLSYSGIVTVTDDLGFSGSRAFNFDVGPTRNQSPVIDKAQIDDGLLTVIAHDEDGDPLTYTLTLPVGTTGDVLTGDYTAGGLTFALGSIGLVDGLTGDVTIIISDGKSDSDPVITPIDICPIDPAPGTLYAVDVGDNTIAIITGATANPLNYINGIGLTVGGDLEYEFGSFNVGCPGGSTTEIDGAWKMMCPQKFLTPPDDYIVRSEIGEGRGRIDLNLTPVHGSEVLNMKGVLMNFRLTGNPGTYKLGFQQEFGVERTYYSDGLRQTYFWETLMADENGNLAPGIDVDNTFTLK